MAVRHHLRGDLSPPCHTYLSPPFVTTLTKFVTTLKMVLSYKFWCLMSKGNPQLSVRIPQDLADLLEAKVEELNSDRSKVIILALKNLLQPPNPADELSEVKQQLASLAAAMARLSPELPQRRS